VGTKQFTARSHRPTDGPPRLVVRWACLTAVALVLIGIPLSGAHVHLDGACHDHCALCMFAHVAAVVEPLTVIPDVTTCEAERVDAPVSRRVSARRTAAAPRAPPMA